LAVFLSCSVLVAELTGEALIDKVEQMMPTYNKHIVK